MVVISMDLEEGSKGYKGRWISRTIRFNLRDFVSISVSSSLEDESVASGSLQMTRIFRVIFCSSFLDLDFFPKLF